MQIKEIYFSTSSNARLAAAKQIFWKKGIIIKPLPKSYSEVQAKTGKDIALATAKQASKEYRMPVLREYKSLYISTLGGFPGPYLHHFHHEIQVEDLIEILKNHSDRKGEFLIDAVLALPDNNIIESTTKIPITLSKKPQGDKGNWEKIMIRENTKLSFSQEIESNKPEFFTLWHQNLTNLADQVSKS